MFDQIPDVANSQRLNLLSAKLDKVGMSEIETPLRLEIPGYGSFLTMANADAYVSVDDPQSKGIHMSRLYLKLQQTLEQKIFSLQALEALLVEFIESHQGISESAYINISYNHPVRKKALLSDNYGWRSYPVTVCAARKNGVSSLKINLEVTYSSTCPCSAALARQVIQKKFADTFQQETFSKEEMLEWLGKEEAICATPHGQRSKAFISFTPKTSDQINILDILFDVEQSLKTPVQAAVKRIDEQEFAKLNGENLMFAEDAVRRVRQTLESNAAIVDYHVRAEHYESLHPHSAVAETSKFN